MTLSWTDSRKEELGIEEASSLNLKKAFRRLENFFRRRCRCASRGAFWNHSDLCSEGCDGATYVALEGWTEESEELREALEEAVVMTVSEWQEAPPKHVKSQSQGGRSVTYRDKPSGQVPDAAIAHLKPWDCRPPITSLP